MPRGRHSLAPSTVRRPQKLRRIIVLAVIATSLVVALGVVLSGAASPDRMSSRSASASLVDGGTRVSDSIAAARQERAARISRSTERSPLAGAAPRATGKLWTTAPLNLRIKPAEHTRTVGQVENGKRIPVTGRRQGGYAEVVVKGAARWVTADYLSKNKVVAPGSKGLVDTPCAGTSSVESGLTSGAVRVYRAVCNNFPQITQYGGYAARGEHASGKAIDVMTSDSTLGGQIAAFLQRNASALNLYDIIWQQHIWTPVRASEGWRSMSDRGSETANHFDHVHVSVN